MTIENQTYFAINDYNVSEVNNPCLLDILENEIGKDGCSTYLLKLFQATADPTYANQLKFKFSVNDILTGEDGVTPVMSKTVFTEIVDPITQIKTTTAYVKFNREKLQNASKEFLATVILHEITHGFLHIQSPLTDQPTHHKSIFENHVPQIALSVGELYPTLNAVDATAMALQGLDDYFFIPGTTTYDDTKDARCLEYYGMSLSYARNRSLEYLNGTKGTKCQ
jgi:hypothetical protein